MFSMSTEGVLTRAQCIRRDNAEQEDPHFETQIWSVISDLYLPAAAAIPAIKASNFPTNKENTLLADQGYLCPKNVVSRSSHSSRSSRVSKAWKDALLRLATARTKMDKLIETESLECEEYELHVREAENDAEFHRRCEE